MAGKRHRYPSEAGERDQMLVADMMQSGAWLAARRTGRTN